MSIISQVLRLRNYDRRSYIAILTTLTGHLNASAIGYAKGELDPIVN